MSELRQTPNQQVPQQFPPPGAGQGTYQPIPQSGVIGQDPAQSFQPTAPQPTLPQSYYNPGFWGGLDPNIQQAAYFTPGQWGPQGYEYSGGAPPFPGGYRAPGGATISGGGEGGGGAAGRPTTPFHILNAPDIETARANYQSIFGHPMPPAVENAWRQSFGMGRAQADIAQMRQGRAQRQQAEMAQNIATRVPRDPYLQEMPDPSRQQAPGERYFAIMDRNTNEKIGDVEAYQRVDQPQHMQGRIGEPVARFYQEHPYMQGKPGVYVEWIGKPKGLQAIGRTGMRKLYGEIGDKFPDAWWWGGLRVQGARTISGEGEAEARMRLKDEYGSPVREFFIGPGMLFGEEMADQQQQPQQQPPNFAPAGMPVPGL